MKSVDMWLFLEATDIYIFLLAKIGWKYKSYAKMQIKIALSHQALQQCNFETQFLLIYIFVKLP